MDTVLDAPTERLTLDEATERLSLSQATRYFHPRCHPATLTRWIKPGIRLPDGSGRLKLRAVRIGSKWWTKREWISDFIEAQTAAFGGRSDAVEERSPSEAHRAADRPSAELVKMGA